MRNLSHLRVITNQEVLSSDSDKTNHPVPSLEDFSPNMREDLLQHFVQEGTNVLQSLDHLGNFLMGAGMVMLGYLLSTQLKSQLVHILTKPSNQLFYLSWTCILAWCCAVTLLLRFMYCFIFHLLAGRTIHPSHNKPESIGERIPIKEMTYQEFSQNSSDFQTFIQNNYLQQDQANPEQLWYATFRYTRYMAFRKLMLMNQMRSLLGWAMLFSVVFKLTEMGIHMFR